MTPTPPSIRVYAAGTPLASAHSALIMVHGRGASAADMLGLAAELRLPNVAYLAPEAQGNVWYPRRFLEPVALNEPHLTHALAALDALVAQVAQQMPYERIALLGFSQGACLALEYAARHPRRYGAVFGLSGALIENGDQTRDYAGDLGGTPVLLGCSDVDFHIPLARVQRSSDLLGKLGAVVDERIYAGMGHTINDDEIAAIRHQMEQLR